MELNLGGISRIVNIKVPCAFVIGDMQGGDKLCCSAASYSNKISQIFQKCNVCRQDVGNPDVECSLIRMVRIKWVVVNNQKESLKI